MGKHLTIEERLNAKNEMLSNKKKIKRLREKKRNLLHRGEVFNQLKQEIIHLQNRNRKLYDFINNSKRSKHRGLYGIDGFCYKRFGKMVNELTAEERREYMRLKQRERRGKMKNGGDK